MDTSPSKPSQKIVRLRLEVEFDVETQEAIHLANELADKARECGRVVKAELKVPRSVLKLEGAK